MNDLPKKLSFSNAGRRNWRITGKMTITRAKAGSAPSLGRWISRDPIGERGGGLEYTLWLQTMQKVI